MNVHTKQIYISMFEPTFCFALRFEISICCELWCMTNDSVEVDLCETIVDIVVTANLAEQILQKTDERGSAKVLNMQR